MDKSRVNKWEKVLFKRKPVTFIAHPQNIKDDAEVCWRTVRDSRVKV